MSISLYDISVRNYLQTLGAVANFLDKGCAHCEASGIDLNEVVETRLYPDMLPFRYQLVSVVHHSLGAIQGIQSGLFVPPAKDNELDYAGLQKRIAEATTELQDYTPDTVNALFGTKVEFRLGERSMYFLAEDFVTSFSLPNFYFHATTAYDILRMKGAPIGKRDFLGWLRLLKT